MSGAEALDLSPGSVLVLDEAQWTVELHEPHLGHVQLVAADGVRQRVSYRFLVNHPRCRTSSQSKGAWVDRGRQPATMRDLTAEQLKIVKLRFAHLMELNCGYRSGDADKPAPGEPKPQYDPDRTTLGERRAAKVAELAALNPEEAQMLGLANVGVRTLERWEGKRQRFGLIGCADGRWLREGGGHPSISEEVRQAILAVREETRHRSRVNGRTRATMIRRYIGETFDDPDAIEVPSYHTLRRVWHEWFGSGGARQRYERSADLPRKNGYVVVIRPGQVVALDTTILPVMVREHVFGEPVRVHLTLALDVYTHSICAFRLTLVSDTSVDVAMVLRDVMLPLPMRPEWPQEMEWPYPGLPAAVVAQFAGHPVAGLPFFSPETVTADHGAVYRNHHLVEVQEAIGCRVLPARVLRPTDKQAVERVFRSIRSLLFEHLPGYTGVDAADRGAAPEDDATLSIDAMESLIARWVVQVWQNRRLGDYAPSWDPDGDHSPNSLFASSFGQVGFPMEIPSPELYYRFLPEHRVRRIHGHRGVKIKGLWYWDEVLEPFEHQQSTRGGARKHTWVIRREPRDRRTVFFQHPLTHEWHPLRWTGMPPEGEVPAFGDLRAEELLATVRQAGLKPRTDAELLPILLELMGTHDPVAKWPTQMTKTQRTQLAREVGQGKAAARDRPRTTGRAPQPLPRAAGESAARTAAETRAQETALSLEAHRRRRRNEVAMSPPGLPTELGSSYRTRNLFALPNDSETNPDDTAQEPSDEHLGKE
ncbi:transposase [Streptomyces sp. NPDC051940]|uniref:transposase n=1 Tax=Streptomyces sp. NPDC051940 TaxID=3155675 RepID=UPI0034468F72